MVRVTVLPVVLMVIPPAPVILPSKVSSAAVPEKVRVLAPRLIVPDPVTWFRLSASSSFRMPADSTSTEPSFSVAPPPSSSTVGAPLAPMVQVLAVEAVPVRVQSVEPLTLTPLPKVPILLTLKLAVPAGPSAKLRVALALPVIDPVTDEPPKMLIVLELAPETSTEPAEPMCAAVPTSRTSLTPIAVNAPVTDPVTATVSLWAKSERPPLLLIEPLKVVVLGASAVRTSTLPAPLTFCEKVFEPRPAWARARMPPPDSVTPPAVPFRLSVEAVKVASLMDVPPW